MDPYDGIDLTDHDSPPPPYPCDVCGTGIAPRWSPGRHPRHPQHRRWARPDPDMRGCRLCRQCRDEQHRRDERRRMDGLLASWQVPLRHRGHRYLTREHQAGRRMAELMQVCRTTGRLGVLDSMAHSVGKVDAYDPRSGGGLLLIGPVGSGKSTLAASVLYRLAEDGPARAMWCGEEALQRAAYGHSYAQGAGPLQRARDASVLVLDDLGTARPTEHWLTGICGVLAHRWDEGLATVITTNLSPHEIGERYGERTRSRLVDMCEVVVLRGPDWRSM